jgi:hypothetical protein
MMDLLTNNNRPAGDGLISKTVDGIHELSKYSPEIGFALSTLSIMGIQLTPILVKQ